MSYQIFEKNYVEKVNWSNFNLSHEWKGSIDMSYLVPIDCIECLPNDRFKGSTEAYIQFAPMIYPVMHRINCKIYHFFVPNRLLWKFWQKFIYDGEIDTQPTKPYATIGKLFAMDLIGINSLADYMGLPVKNFHNIEYTAMSQEVVNTPIDLLPFMAYQLIYNDYFRDENLSVDLFSDDEDNPTIVSQSLYQNVYLHRGEVTSGTILQELFTLRKKAWEKDYFTSALPSPQLGDPAKVPVVGRAVIQQGTEQPVQTRFETNRTSTAEQFIPGIRFEQRQQEGAKNLTIGMYTESSDNLERTEVGGSTGVYVPLGGVPIDIDGLSFTISDLRLASAIQRMQEALARGGHRYKEAMITMYNQITPDYRLDRPEFLGSATIPVVVNPVEQTSQTTPTSPQASLAGRASVYGNKNGFSYHCKEHGFIITLATVLPRTSYCQGLSRLFTRFDRYDYHNPYFENLGDQDVKHKELYFNIDSRDGDNDSTFGYAPRFSEYKYMPSTVHGDFLDSLDFMTLVRMFNRQPALNESFIQVDENTTNRAFAVVEDQQENIGHLYATFYHNITARRPMQGNPIPKLL